ncbi:ATG8-interacting protein 2 isoform X3 [Phoenix dactylifera]|uniref:ATG8-interacting protein 2 isoform X3 n=1 Tax=Phoenix dactylifera TaxID=42345 RepID=A0A8B7D0F1_PHODC|nr:ATG8-interacting protein 2 isoform X3 [Phoenix dactylifera]XP_008810134.2 ATG8-interacting protein 2 isoform X3 [Phoenix dactylifera]
MADDEKEREGTPSRGAEWEVVSLTASTYAAAPGPKGFFEPADENKDKEFNKNESESSEGQKGSLAEDDNEPKQMYEENVRSKSDDIPHGIQYGMEYEEGKGLQELNLVQEEQGMYVDPEFSSFHSETGRSDLLPHAESTEFYEHSPQNLESPPEYAKKNEENRSDEDEYGPPSEAWWKRHAASLYHHVKEANTFWSVCVAAALMGLVILGQQWQREKWQLHQLKWRFSINDEKVIKMLGPLGRFKDVLVGGHRRSIRDGAASATL